MIELVYIMAKSKWGRQVVKGLSEAQNLKVPARAEGRGLDFYTKLKSIWDYFSRSRMVWVVRFAFACWLLGELTQQVWKHDITWLVLHDRPLPQGAQIVSVCCFYHLLVT